MYHGSIIAVCGVFNVVVREFSLKEGRLVLIVSTCLVQFVGFVAIAGKEVAYGHA